MKLGVLDKENIHGLTNLFNFYGTKAFHTDFSLLNGGDVTFDYLISDDENKRALADYWTGIQCDGGIAIIINSLGNNEMAFIDQRNIGIRLVMKYSDVRHLITNEKSIDNFISEVLLGYYPQIACSGDIRSNLERLYRSDELPLIDRSCLINGENIQKAGFVPLIIPQYDYLGKHYVRIKSNILYPNLQLSNNELSNNGLYHWIEVIPLTWLVDKKNNLMITRDIILSGIPFEINKYFCDREMPFLDLFVKEQLVKDIFYEYLEEKKNPTKEVEKVFKK